MKFRRSVARLVLLLVSILLLASLTSAQTPTLVTGTITDPNGLPYSFARISAQLIPSTGTPTIIVGGIPVQIGGQNNATTDVSGNFTMNLFCNSAGGGCSVISPSGTQWQFTVNFNGIPPPFGSGPQSFAVTLTITGASQVISANLNAAAPSLGKGILAGSFTGNTIFNNSAGAGANDITAGMLNRIRLWCANGSGYRFATAEAALSDIATNSTQGGYAFSCPDNTTDTSPGQVEIGSATKTAAINLHPGNTWQDNSSVFHTYFLGVHNGSALFGENNGTQGAGRTGGANVTEGCLANNNYVINTPEGQSGNGQAYMRLEHLWVQGCTTGTVGAGAPAIAAVNIEALSGMNTIRDLYITGFANATQTRIASNNNSAASQVGPLHIDNVWNACVYLPGCQPLTIMAGSSTSQGVLPILVSAGASLNPGNGVSLVKINGNSDPGAIFGGHFDAHYTEQLVNPSGSLHYDINDANNFAWTGGASSSIAADTIFDIKQSAAGRTCNLTIENQRVGNSGSTAINNHISLFTLTGINYISFYHWRGDSSCSVSPFTIDSNAVQLLNTSGSALLIKNLANSEVDLDLNSGLNVTGQNAFIRFFDHNVSDVTPQFFDGITGATHSFILANTGTNFFVQAIPAGELDFNAWGASGIQFNSRANSVGPPARWYSAGATPIEIGRVDTSGNIFFHCATTTFQNCGELTGSFSGAASARIFTFPDVSTNISAAGMVTSTYTNATTTASNITGLSFPVAANKNYTMTCNLYYQGSASTAGLDITVTGPAAPTSVFYSYEEDPTATSIQDSVASAFGTKLTGNAAVTATTNLSAKITLGLQNGANAGTVQVQGSATGAGTVTVQVGSFCRLQ